MGTRTALGILALVLLAAGGENLLPNGGFANGVDGWVFFQLGGEDAREIDGEALHVTKAADTPERPAMIWTDYALAPDREGALAFSLRAKGRKLGRTQIVFIVWDDAGNAAAEEVALDGKPAAKWKTFKAEVKIPGPAKGGRILVRLYGKGELWLDDASVAIVGTSPPPPEAKGGGGLRNGDFDRSKDGWTALPGSEGVKAALDGKELRLSRSGHRLYPEGGVQQVVDLKGRRKSVTLRCRARAEGATACVAFLAETKEGALAAYGRGEPSGELTLPLELPTSAARLRVVLAIRGAGDAWFDDVRIE